MSVIGIILGVIALGLIYWLRKEQTMDNGLNAAETQHTHQGMNAMMDDFNNYQFETDRKIAHLEKQLEIKTKNIDRQVEKSSAKHVRKGIANFINSRANDTPLEKS